jgi:PASTA domain/Putative Ig domain/PKD domain
MNKNKNRTRYLVLLTLLTVFLTAVAQVSGLRIGNYVLVSKTRISVLEYRLTYKADLINGSTTNITSATAKLSPIFNLITTDNQLSFGSVAAGKATTSTDTFTLRWSVFNPVSPKLLEKILIWQISTTNNAAPIANAGPDQTVSLGSIASLDGSASSDLDGDTLTYQWSITTKPTDSAAALTNPTSATPNFVVDKSGQYTARLVVNDGKFSSSADIVIISTLNSAPTANAGADQTIFVNDSVALDGTGSTDVDGDPLTYRWNITSSPTGSGAALTNPTTAHPTFTADKPGDYAIQLIVNDGTVDSAVDSVTVSTQNSAPIANAGADQSVAFNSLVALDGSSSKDVDQNPLTYRWSIISKPPLSGAELINSTTVSPTFTANKAGSYTVQLIVNDGTVDSQPDTVIISTLNTRPVAIAGQDQTVNTGSLVNLDGSGSTDAEDDNLTYQWSLLSAPSGSIADLVDAQSATPSFTPLIVGEYITQLIVNDGQLASEPDTVQINVTTTIPNNQLPQITSTPVTTATVGTAYSYDVNATDADVGDILGYSLQASPTGMTINSATGVIQWMPVVAQVGNQAVTIQVSDNHGGITSQTYSILVSDVVAQILVPDVVGQTEAQATSAITGANLVVGTITRTTSETVAAGNVIFQDPAASTQVTANSAVNLSISSGSANNGLPPDPATVAPPIDPTVATTLDISTKFLYTGANPIQTGVAPNTIEAKRVAILRGKILDKANAPLPGVTVTILNHPEFGQTISRADGMYDMAVNGGGLLTLNYQKAAFATSQRQANAPWQDFALIDDVVLIQLDSKVTAIDLSNTTAMQVAKGNPVTDADGIRQATLLFQPGTQATMTLADGSTSTLANFHIRATEFTVGANGPNSMPASLPPTSGYTYEVEYSVDEAQGTGATSVAFSLPIISYTENFLNFPVGSLVPYGEYDRKKGMWIASDNGKVIKILGVTGGQASLDIDGSGQAATTTDLTALGVTDQELQNLGTLYPTGQSLWRVPIAHILVIN